MTTAAHWKIATLLGIASFLSFLYFYEGGGWNQNSRFDLVRAITERHTLQIDAYHENTQDKAHFRGHYYSDKAPGLVLLAVPFVEAARGAMRALGIDPDSPREEYVLSYIITAVALALPTAFAAICLFYLALRFGSDLTGASLASAIFSIGTPMLAYATLFWAHALVASCLLFAYAAALKLREAQHVFWWALAVGVTAGWATVTEYPAVPASALLAFFALSNVWSRGPRARRTSTAGIAIGAVPCAIILFTYLHAAFGGFRPSYSYYDPNSFSFMQQQGYLGLTYPHPDRILKLLFGCSRGLFFASPILLAGVVGLWWLGKRQPGPTLIAAASAVYYLLFNASFYWWKAGLTFGPRYAAPAIPILCLGLAVAWTQASVRWRRILMVLACCSIFVTLMVVSTSSQLAMQDSCPIVHSSWSQFWSGNLATNHESVLLPTEAKGGYAAFNVGQRIGLHGLSSLLPLLLEWGVAAALWWRLSRDNI
jgi:4-amino-4-deoxy-L-arabinose transferase-like glycosyltransferase